MRKELLALAAVGILSMAAGCGTITQAETISGSGTQAAESNIQEPFGSGAQSRENASGVSGGPGEEQVQETNEGKESGEAMESRVLIAYFSRWGNTDYPEDVDATTSASIVAEENRQYGTTEYMARMIWEVTGGDLYLIQTEETYPTDFQEVIDQGHRETDEGVIPALKSAPVDMSGYDVVFVGYPVWASDVPRAIRSFLQAYDMTEKTVIPFCTHDGYGAGRSYATVAELCPGAETLSGLGVEAEDIPGARSQVEEWLGGLGITEKLSQVSLQNSGKDSAYAAGETAIRITAGDQELTGILYDNGEARQFLSMLPLTVSMAGFGGREFYGGIQGSIETEGEGQYFFEDGQITYCPANNTAAIFYAQTDRPNLTMEVFPMGIVTSDLSVFDQLPGRVEITFELAEVDSSKAVKVQESIGKSNILIAYFTWAENTKIEHPETVDVDATTSASVLLPGNTARLAGWIQEETGGDLFSIVTAQPYSSDYEECLDRVGKEQAGKARPKLAETVKNMDQYDVVFLGFPNWQGTCPVAVFSFLDSYDFTGKTIIPFCSHGTGGVGRSIRDLKEAISGVEILEEIGIYRQDTEGVRPEIEKWVRELGMAD